MQVEALSTNTGYPCVCRLTEPRQQGLAAHKYNAKHTAPDTLSDNALLLLLLIFPARSDSLTSQVELNRILISYPLFTLDFLAIVWHNA